MGLIDPIPVQYVRYMKGVIPRVNFGASLINYKTKRYTDFSFIPNPIILLNRDALALSDWDNLSEWLH